MASSCNVIVQSQKKGVEDCSKAAAAAIKPGHIIELTSAGTYQVHSSAASNAACCIAEEQGELNKGTTDAYAQYDYVKAYYMLPGEQAYFRVAAGATAITKGFFLESAGDGTVRKLGTDAATDQDQRAAIVCRADETVDNSGGASEVFILATAV